MNKANPGITLPKTELQRLREARGWSVSELAYKACKTRRFGNIVYKMETTIHLIEGKQVVLFHVEDGTEDLATVLADALGVDVKDILGVTYGVYKGD